MLIKIIQNGIESDWFQLTKKAHRELLRAKPEAAIVHIEDVYPDSPDAGKLVRLEFRLFTTLTREFTLERLKQEKQDTRHMLFLPDVMPQRQSYTYANEADVLNIALFGITAKEWRQAHPNTKGNIRDEASLQQLIVLANLESINAELIRQGVPQSERLLRLNASAKQMMQSLTNDHRIEAFKEYGTLRMSPNKKARQEKK